MRLLRWLFLLLWLPAVAPATIVYYEDWSGYSVGTNVTFTPTPNYLRSNLYTGDQVTVANNAAWGGGANAITWPGGAYFMNQTYQGATYTYTSLTVRCGGGNPGGGRKKISVRVGNGAGGVSPDGGYMLDYLSGSTLTIYETAAGGGSQAVLTSTTHTISDYTDFTMTLIADGSDLYGFINGVLVLSASDATFSSGRIALSTYGGGFYFGTVTVDDGVTGDTPTMTRTYTLTPTITPTFTPSMTPTITPTQVSCGAYVRIAQYGDSFQQGNGCAAAESTEDGLRDILINELQQRWRRSAYMVGGHSYGTRLACPYSDAVTGSTTAVILSTLQSTLATRFPNPSPNDVVLIGGGTAGQILGESSATIQANWQSMMDFVHAYSPVMQMVLINPAWCPSQTFSVTNNAFQTAAIYGHAKGYKLATYNPYPTLGENAALYVCADNIHPNHAAQVIMGTELAVVVDRALRGVLPKNPIWVLPTFPPWK